MSDIKDALLSDQPLRSPKGLGALAIIDAIVLVVAFIAEGFLGHTVSNMNAWTSCAVVFLPLAAILVVSGFLLIKNSMLGYYVGWVAAIVALALGIMLTFGIVKNNIFMDIYILLTGILNVVILLYPATREGLQ